MHKTIKKFKLLLRLYRLDVAVLIFLGTLAGRILTTELTWIHFVQAIFLSAFPYNFVYALNAITDMPEDRVNKPWRPLPSGSVSDKEAFLWLAFLTLGSCALIPVLFSGVEIFLAYLIMFMGMSYSIQPFVFKKRAFLAPMVTGWGIIHPLILTGKTTIALVSVSLLFHGFAVTFLKDLSDTEGDKKAGRKIITEIISITQLVLLSGFLNIVSAIGFLLSDYRSAAFIPASSFILINYEYFHRRRAFNDSIYKKAIKLTITGSLIITIFYFFYL